MKELAMRQRLLPFLIAVFTLWPVLAGASERPKAGVVTALHGEAMVARAVFQKAIPLKFKDNVFLKDRIDTRENSAVRLLLGGKALVTVRELSTFTITEEPGKAVVDLKVGTLALGLVKNLLKPGEVIEVRTPNAVAGVRGSLIRVSVKIIDGNSYTTVSVLEASKTVTVAPRANPAALLHLLSDDMVSISGDGAATKIGPIEKMTPLQRREARTTVDVAKPKEQSEKPPERVIAKVTTDHLEAAYRIAAQLGPKRESGDSVAAARSEKSDSGFVKNGSGPQQNGSNGLDLSKLSAPALPRLKHAERSLYAPSVNEYSVTKGMQYFQTK